MSELYNYLKRDEALPNELDDSNYIADEDYQARINICYECPEFIDNEIGVGYDYETESYESVEIVKQCQLCNCQMEIKAKLENVKCPLDKW